MKVSRILLALLLAAFAACAANADSIDPTVIIRQVDPAPLPITSPTEIFNLFATAHQNIFAFQNDTGITLDSLTLDLFGANVSLLFSCGSFAGGNIFSTCTSTPGSQGDTIVSFFGVGNGFTGIAPATCVSDDEGKGDDEHAPKNNNHDDKPTCTGGIYSLEFGGIPNGAVVRGTGTFQTPEPMTALLLVGGLAGLAASRKRRSS